MTQEKDIPEVIKQLLEEEDEAREIRRMHADWEFIKRQETRVRLALKYFVETGDLYVASRIANLTIDEFNELRKKANIPMVP